MHRISFRGTGLSLLFTSISACGGDDGATGGGVTAGEAGTSVTGGESATATDGTASGGSASASTSNSGSSTVTSSDTGGTTGMSGSDTASSSGGASTSGTTGGTIGTTGTDTSTSGTAGDTTTGGCLANSDCDPGTICDTGACIPGCADDAPCPAPDSCCSGACVNTEVEIDHCGMCDIPCPMPENAPATCANFMCGVGLCDMGYSDCDGMPGCESAGVCACTPGDMQDCYTGPMDTLGVGKCMSGTQTCNPQGTGWEACMNDITPDPAETCGNNIDDNCDNAVDEDPDNDGDNWTVCGGDCCDVPGPACFTPNLVNPGAFEVDNNMVDDDCDGMVDNPVPGCDVGLASNSADPLDHARAIDLCQFTTENPPQAQKKWGVISGFWNRANGANTPAAAARSIRTGFGNVIVPNLGSSLSVLATGNAADPGDANPGFINFQNPGADLGADSAPPTDWLAANGNILPNDPTCPDPQGGVGGSRDTIQLRLRIRVPTNANSFSVMMYFFSSEYPEWVCSPYNDFFVALVDSTDLGNPADKNIAVANINNTLYPIGVNIIQQSTSLFEQCTNGPTGCGGGSIPGVYNGCTANNELVGTGFETLNPTPKFGADLGYCMTNNQLGGGTGWLKMAGNVTPGETMEIRFDLWDTGDEWYDSLILLDDWEWSVTASDPGVTPG